MSRRNELQSTDSKQGTAPNSSYGLLKYLCRPYGAILWTICTTNHSTHMSHVQWFLRDYLQWFSIFLRLFHWFLQKFSKHFSREHFCKHFWEISHGITYSPPRILLIENFVRDSSRNTFRDCSRDSFYECFKYFFSGIPSENLRFLQGFNQSFVPKLLLGFS